MDSYVFHMQLGYDAAPGAFVEAHIVTSTKCPYDVSMMSYFAMNLESGTGTLQTTKALEAYSRAVDSMIARHWESVLSQIAEGVSSAESRESQSELCAAHPLNFGACIATALHMLAERNATGTTTMSARRSLPVTATSEDVARALANTAKDLKGTLPSSTTDMKMIQVSGIQATPMNAYISLMEVRHQLQIITLPSLLQQNNNKDVHTMLTFPSQSLTQTHFILLLGTSPEAK